jgi:hypothetical protein
MKQDRGHLVEHLRDEIGFLRKRGEAFDAGDIAEAKQLAVAIRVRCTTPPGVGRARSCAS